MILVKKARGEHRWREGPRHQIRRRVHHVLQEALRSTHRRRPLERGFEAQGRRPERVLNGWYLAWFRDNPTKERGERQQRGES